MTPDRNPRDDAAQRASARRTGWVFIAITVVMAALTLSLPYVVHRIRAAPDREALRSTPGAVPAR